LIEALTENVDGPRPFTGNGVIENASPGVCSFAARVVSCRQNASPRVADAGSR
jgi:hypothetical protein